jgi:hypothetical protein
MDRFKQNHLRLVIQNANWHYRFIGLNTQYFFSGKHRNLHFDNRKMQIFHLKTKDNHGFFSAGTMTRMFSNINKGK